MNRCKNYLIKCPFALVSWEELPCFVNDKYHGVGMCDKWKEKYKKELPEEYEVCMNLRKELKRNNLDLKNLEKIISEKLR